MLFDHCDRIDASLSQTEAKNYSPKSNFFNWQDN